MAGRHSTNNGLTPLPPSVLHRSTRLTHAQAHTHLSNFLLLAENDASYRPDSTLTTRGPQSVSTGAGTTDANSQNLTLHNLSRILRGIEGKKLGAVTVTAPAAAATEPEQKHSEKKEQRGTIEWQDKEDYDLAQQDQNVDINVVAEERHPGAGLEEPGDEREADRTIQIEIEDTNEKVGLDGQRGATDKNKKARKDAKKNRRKLEKRAKEDAKANR